MIEIVETDAIEEPGAYRMRKEAYQKDPCPMPSLSRSIAKILLDASPLHAWHEHRRLNPDWLPGPSKKNLELGSACHRLLFGAGPEIAVLEHKSFQSKQAKAERKDAIQFGEIPLLRREYDKAIAIVKAAREQLAASEPPARQLVMPTGDVEVVVATDLLEGSWIRAQLDWWSEDRTVLVDYKTTEMLVAEEVFTSQISRMGYDIQDAFYIRTVEETFPEFAGRLRFLIVAQEVHKPPYALNVFEVSESDRTLAAREVDRAICIWSECMRTNKWPCYPPGIKRVGLPEWHIRRRLDRELIEGEDEGDWIFAGRRRWERNAIGDSS